MRLHGPLPKDDHRQLNLSAPKATLFAALAVPLISFCANRSDAIVPKDAHNFDGKPAASVSASTTTSRYAGPLSELFFPSQSAPATSQSRTQAKIQPRCFFSDDNFYFKTPDGAVNAVLDMLDTQKSKEHSLGIGCKDQYAFVLTNSMQGNSLIVVYGKNTTRPAGLDPNTTYTKLSMSNIMTAPFSSWTQSQDTAYIVAQNRIMLSVSYPFRGKVLSERLPFDTAKTQTALIGRWIVIANDKQDIGIISNDLQTKKHYRISSAIHNPVLKSDGQAASFGTVSSPEVEIRLNQNNDAEVSEKGNALPPLPR